MRNYWKNNGKFILYVILSLFIYIMANGEWSIPAFAWIYPLMFLYIIHSRPSRKSCFLLICIYAAGFFIQFAHVIQMDYRICGAVSILLAVFKIIPYVIWMKSKKCFLSTISFAASVVMIEYAVYLIYPILGGLSDAYTQYRNLYLLQIVTVTGVYGISFIMYWSAAMILWTWNNRSNISRIKKYILIYAGILGAVFFYGIFMLQFGEKPDNSVRIAGITVPVSELLNEDKDVYSVFYTDTFTDENMANAKKKLSNITEELFFKTAQEAQAGAKLVFWSELNGAVLKEEEAKLLQKASAVAKEQRIYLMVSLLVKTPYEELKENKVVIFDSQGKKTAEYFKYGRSAGELCMKGDGKIKRVDTEYGSFAPFICSDMAFISAIQQAGKGNIDILIVPASDWKEMTQIAVKTAVVRGVENGCNVVRHTNQGISVVSDARGNILFLSDYFQSESKTLAAQVLTEGRFTLFSYLGNTFVYLSGLYLLTMLIIRIKNSKQPYLPCDGGTGKRPPEIV